MSVDLPAPLGPSSPIARLFKTPVRPRRIVRLPSCTSSPLSSIVGFIIYQSLRIGLARSSMIRQTQQVDQGWKTWIQVKELAAAGHFDAVTFPISTKYAGLGVGCQLLNERQLAGSKLGRERFQNGAEILVNHRRKVRLVVAGKESAKRSGASQRCAACVSLQRRDDQRARGRHDHISVCEGVVALGRQPSALRLNGVKRSSTDLCLIERYARLVGLLRFPVNGLYQLIYGYLKGP